jgi:uroporphyrinogen decarboxylase
MREFLTEPAKMAKAILNYHDMFNPDICLVMGDMLYEVEAMGTEVEFPEDDLCREKNYLLADKANLAKLEVPDPRKDGRLPTYLEVCERVRSVVKDSNVSGVACGPWQIAVLLRDAEALIRDTFKDPDFVHELMKFTSEVAKRVILAQSEVGIGISFSEAACSLNLISPTIYKNFVLPYHKEIVNHCKERKVGLAMHICGHIDAIMEDVVSTGITAISVDEGSSLKKMIEVAKGKAVVIGNVPVGSRWRKQSRIVSMSRLKIAVISWPQAVKFPANRLLKMSGTSLKREPSTGVTASSLRVVGAEQSKYEPLISF